jgi:hypothetical protein
MQKLRQMSEGMQSKVGAQEEVEALKKKLVLATDCLESAKVQMQSMVPLSELKAANTHREALRRQMEPMLEERSRLAERLVYFQSELARIQGLQAEHQRTNEPQFNEVQ